MLLTDINYIVLVLMLSASLFFLMAGIRSLRNACFEGLLFVAVALFFVVAHIFYLNNLPISSEVSFLIRRFDIWVWLTYLFAPSLIVLFISFGIVNFFLDYFQFGLIKIFFGMTLLCYLFMIGNTWPFDVRGIITILFSFAWFEVELSTET